MPDLDPSLPSVTRGLSHARELERHLGALDAITPAALGVLAVASGIYTYLGVSSLLDDSGALSFFAAVAYSVAVSVAIFVFWSFLMRLLPAVRTASARTGLMLCMALGSAAIIAMSSWLNAAALAGAAAVEQHLARTVQDYQAALEQSHSIAVAGQALGRDVARVRQNFADLSAQEATGDLSGVGGRGAVFRLLTQKADELAALEGQIEAQAPLVDAAFVEGNAILSRMRALTVGAGPVDARSVEFSEESVRLAGLIAQLRQLSVAPLVDRAAQDLARSVVLPDLDGATADIRTSQESTIGSVLAVLGQRAESLREAAIAVESMTAPAETTYTPISSADAVIRYAGNFVPAWAGAIAIDLLPAVLVFILMVTQSAIRNSRDPVPLVERMTLAEMRAAVSAFRSLEADDRPPPDTPRRDVVPEDGSGPLAEPAISGATEVGRVEKLEPRKPREAPLA